ncbi:MAG: enoyl-CoA hydratase/isomerase family protein [Myxococcaceae bacterium]|nr:enoyl-CoA hydratase/isomerase family protein [Myxococcaceae bacterium]
MSFENLKIESQAGIATLTIDRPKALNALNTKTLTELAAALESIAADKAVRALVITGAGEKAFVAGADIAEMADLTPDDARRFSELGHRVLLELEALPIPTIAAVNGFALGGGCELMLACDLAYASEKARLGLPEVTLGVIPGFGGTQRLTRLVGRQRAKELIFTGDMIDAVRAKEVGLVLDVVAPERLLPHCQEVAAKIASRGPVAVAQAKRVIESGADADLRAACELERQAFGLLFGTRDQKEGMKAFMEKRKPAFQGA